MAKKLCPRCRTREKYRIEHGKYAGSLASYCRKCDRERALERWRKIPADEKKKIAEHRKHYNRKRYTELKPLAQSYRWGKTQEDKNVIDFLSACGKLIDEGFMGGLGFCPKYHRRYKSWEDTPNE